MIVSRENFLMLFSIANDASSSESIRDLVYRYFLYALDPDTEDMDGGLSEENFIFELSRILETRKLLHQEQFNKFYPDVCLPDDSISGGMKGNA